MATSTYLSNPKVEVGASSGSVVDITDQVSSCVVNYNVEALEDTAFGSTARTNTAGLQSNSATLTVYASYASSETYATLSALVGTKCFIRVTPVDTTISATNPAFELTNTYLGALPVVNATLGELSTYDIEFMGGTYVADTTP
ncbi:MAG: hypothetical protein ACO3SE_08720 [Sedimenticolaceae bacterium]|jgi:hypothetical protein